MESSIEQVFSTEKTHTKCTKEKSTIDKVFEELDVETETDKLEEAASETQFTSVGKSDLGDFVLASDVHENEREDHNKNILIDYVKTNFKPPETKSEETSSDITNLMQHTDIGQTDSIKTKDGIELSDLLADRFEDKATDIDTKKQTNNLLDSDTLEIVSKGAEAKQNDANSFVFTDSNNIHLGNQVDPKSFQEDARQLHSTAVDLQTSTQIVQNTFPSVSKHVGAVFDLSKDSTRFPEYSLEHNTQTNPTIDRSHLNYHINHIPSPSSEGSSFDEAQFTPYDARLTETSQYYHNQDFASGDFNADLPVSADDLLSKYKQMEVQQEMLNHSLISLSTHFAQVQLRLKQIINSPQQEQEALLRNLEKFTFIGIPEVNELCLYNYENQSLQETESEKASKSYVEDKLAFEKNKHKEMIGKLRTQLEALENYVYEFSNNDSSEIPTNQIISKQQIIINELKDKLNLNLNLSEEDQLKEEINKSIIHPMKTKEDLILQLKTQIADLEKFINFLQSTQCKCSIEPGQVDMKNKTISIMKKISTILHIFAEHHSSSFKKPATVAAMKKSMKVNHYGDLRAQLEIAIDHVMEACRQPPDQDVPIDSDYMSDTDDPVPCNSKVALAVRKQLAPTLQRLLQHGLRSLNATQTVSVVQYISCASATRRHLASAHIWDLIAKYYEIKEGADFNCKPNRKLSESFNLDIGSGSLGIKQSLLASIGNILAIHHKYKKLNPDSYFKSLVCDGLNKKLLVEWLLLILNYRTLSADVYAPWSYVASTQFSDAAQSLRRLYEFHFSLTIVDVTIRNLQSIKDAF